MSNRDALDLLIGEGTLTRGDWLDAIPARLPDAEPVPLADRIRGMLLGVAIGDALGNTTESVNPDQRASRFGEISDYLPNHHAGDRAVGLPSDDTQLTFRTVAQLIESGELDPTRLLAAFSADPIFGIGQATHEAISRYRENGMDWRYLGAPSAGNGAFMRIAPVLLPYLTAPSAGLWADTVIATAITHRDTAAIATSVSWVAILWDLLGMVTTPAPDWWSDRFIQTVRQVENPETSYRPRGGAWSDFDGCFSAWMDRCHETILTEPSVERAGGLWHSGAFLLETAPSVLHVLTRFASDPEEAMIRAVNDTRDNDTVGAIVGAAIGALYGVNAFPARWREGLLGRIGTDDDGQVQRIIDAAVRRFVVS